MRNLILVLSLSLSFLITNVALASTSVSGTLSSDTTWTLAESPYVVTSDLTIPTGVTLTVEPGVVVKFDGPSAHSMSMEHWMPSAL